MNVPAPPKRQKDWIGAQARTRREVRNGFGVIPQGAIVTVLSVWRGTAEIESAGCPHCGVKLVVSKVCMKALEYVGPVEGSGV